MRALISSERGQRAAPDALARGHGGPPTLWAAGVSGDRPIALLRLGDNAELPRVHELLRAQHHWRGQRLAVDVVLLNTAVGDAGDAVDAALAPLASAQQAQLKAGAELPKAELFAMRQSALSDELRDGLLTAARVLLDPADAAPTAVTPVSALTLAATVPASMPIAAAANTAASTLEFANGCGGFIDGGRAYAIHLDEAQPTPAPWVNVIANPAFGFVVSAEGGGYTWSLNSQQNPLTPWPNDPVNDSPHEVLYLRDEDTGVVWSATALPIRVPGAAYTATHGKGWTRFDNNAHGIELELTQCVPTHDSLKLSRLRLRNRSARARHLSITGYVEWALGANGTTPAPFVITGRDKATGALFARNRWRADFGERVAFIDLAGAQHSMGGDRALFLGPLGSIERPAALRDRAFRRGTGPVRRSADPHRTAA
jgi:cellobiose phosphorylase